MDEADDVDAYFLPGGILDSPSKDDLDNPLHGNISSYASSSSIKSISGSFHLNISFSSKTSRRSRSSSS